MAEHRSHTALVRLSEDEWAAWNEAARAAGYGRTATWVRETIAAHLQKPAEAPQRGDGRWTSAHGEDGGARALAGQVARIGSNLNQLTRALHAAERGGLEGPSNTEVLTMLEATRSELRALRDAHERGQG